MATASAVNEATFRETALNGSTETTWQRRRRALLAELLVDFNKGVEGRRSEVAMEQGFVGSPPPRAEDHTIDLLPLWSFPLPDRFG